MAAEKKKVKTILKMFIGLGVVALGIMSTVVFLPELKKIVLGCLGPVLILVGLVMVAVAKE
jgi:hypothetical protein